MNKVAVYNLEGKVAGEIKLPEFFTTEINQGILHEAAVAELANQRINYAHTKTRGNVSGGGKKPWKQKGTGRARAGSSRSPLWRGGGITFGPTNERNFSKKLNKKVKKLALAMAYASKAQESTIAVMENLSFDNPKTKTAANILNNLPFKSGSVLVAYTVGDKNSNLVFRNIANTSIEPVNAVSVVDLLNHKNLIITKEAIEELEKSFKTSSEKQKTETKEEVKKDEKKVKAEAKATEKSAPKKPASTKSKKVKDE